MKFNVIRKPMIEGQKEKYDFGNGSEYLVKNFTDDDIYVGLSENAEKSDCICIPAECCQIIILRKSPIWETDTLSTLWIIPESTSEKGVEVQCLKW